jgi:transcriptional regulator with GAF, ATPase, and Fis domain
MAERSAEAEARQQNADLIALNDIAELMNRTLDLKQILACTVDQTRSVSKADAAWIYLPEEENRLVMRAHAGLSPDYVRGMRSLRVGDGLEGRVAAENQARFIESTSADVHTHEFWVEKEGLHALAVVPITRPEPETGGNRTETHIVGVLAVGIRARAHTWEPRERRLLTSIANHVALAIDNARLYARVQVDEAGMRAGNQVLREINDMLLQRNAFLEDLIQNDMAPALISSSRIVHLLQTKNIAPLTDTQIGVCAEAQENAIYGLGRVTAEIPDKSWDLYSNWGKSPDAGEDSDHQSGPADYDQSRTAGSRLMSFEQAVAAGLVSAHLSNQE